MEHEIDVPMQVPVLFETLIARGKLEDPFYGLNEHESAVVYQANSTITRDFTIPAEILEKNG